MPFWRRVPSAVLQAGELLEHGVELVRRDAGALVAHGELDKAVLALRVEPQEAVVRGRT